MLDKLHYFTIINDFCFWFILQNICHPYCQNTSPQGEKKKSIYKAWTNKEFFQVGNYIWLLYFHFHFSVSSWKSGRKIPSIYFRALATINPIGQFFIKTNSSSYFSPYKHFWNYLKLDPIPFALKESLQYLVTWEDHMPKSRHRNWQPFLCPQFKSHIPVNRTSIVIEIGGV